MPATIPPAQREETLRRLRRLALLLDGAWEVPGTNFRFGIDAIVGLLPIGGDALTAAASLYIVAEAHRLGVRRRTLLRMLANVAVDSIIGLIPLAGDLFDAGFRANLRNLKLLELDLLDRS